MKSKLVIWGAAGHAKVVADIVRLCGEYELAGFLDDVHPERHNTEFCQASILGGQEQLDRLHQYGVHFLIFGFGHNLARLRLAELIRAKGYGLASAVHPRAVVAADVVIGAGTVVKAGAVIDPGVTVGENAIIGGCAFIGHDCVLDDGARLNGGVSLGGLVKIGRASTVGTGGKIRDRIRIGHHAIIGVGAAVVADIPDEVVAVGVPARVMRKTTPDDY